jgi:hypothetical protein
MNKRSQNNLLIPELLQLVDGLKETIRDAEAKISDIKKIIDAYLANSGSILAQAEGVFSHSPDFRSVFYKGVKYSFTPAQAACVKILCEQYRNNTPEVSSDYILAEIDCCSQKLSDLFKKSHAWGQLIIPGNTRGTYRLNIS